MANQGNSMAYIGHQQRVMIIILNMQSYNYNFGIHSYNFTNEYILQYLAVVNQCGYQWFQQI